MLEGRRFWYLRFLWFVVLTCVAFAQEPGVTDSTIRIGAICTLSGPASSRGRNLMEGLQTFFNDVNDRGGIHERRIVLIVEDDGEDPDQGVAAAQRMVAEEAVFAVASTSGVETTRALLNRGILGDHVPALAGAALSRSLFSGFRRNIFFFGMPYGDQIALAIEYLLKRNPGVSPKMGLLSQDGFLGEEVGEGFHRACTHYGLQIVGEERYGQEISDLSPLVNRLWSAQADHVVLGATAGEAVQIMGEASKLGWFPQFIGLSSSAEPKLLIEAEEGAGNYLVVDYLAEPWEREPGVALMVGKTQKYFPRKGPRDLHRYHVLGYVSGFLVAEALRGAGRALTREAFIRAFESMDSVDTHGLAGVIGYRSGSRAADSRGRVLRFDRASGGFLPLTDWIHPMIKGFQ